MGWVLQQCYRFDGQDVRFDVRGNGPPVVLVHGTPWSSFNWRHVIALLAGDWSVYYYDLLGYGQSEQNDGQAVSLDVQNRVLAGLLDHWGLEQPRIVGHDFGGTTVLRTHLLERHDFSRIVLVDPVALSPWGSPFFSHVKQHEAAFQGIPDDIHEAIVTAYVRGAMHRRMPEETLRGILGPWTGNAGRAAFYRQIAQADRRYTDEIESGYGTVARPVLLLWGEQDRWISPATGRRLHAMIPTSRLITVPNAGHLVPEDAPEFLVEKVNEFFKDAQTAAP